jgi:hypothetical protein
VNIIWVSPFGSDTTGDGSEQSPYLTIEKALTIFVPEDQIRLKDGTYTPVDSLVFSGSGSLVADNPWEVTIQPSAVSATSAVISIANAYRFTIRGIIIKQAVDPTGNFVGIAADTVTYFVCESCSVEDFTANSASLRGISVNDCGGVIKDCSVDNFYNAGANIYGVYAQDLEVVNCVIGSLIGAAGTTVVGVDTDGGIFWPRVVSAAFVDLFTVDVVFDKVMNADFELTNPANYTFTGGVVTALGVTILSTTSVRISTNEMPPATYTIVVARDVTDSGGHPIDPAHNSALFTALAVAPRVQSASGSWRFVTVTFDMDMLNDAALNTPGNYVLDSGAVVTSVTVDSTTQVTLHTDIRQTAGTYSVTVSNVRSLSYGVLIDPAHNSGPYTISLLANRLLIGFGPAYVVPGYGTYYPPCARVYDPNSQTVTPNDTISPLIRWHHGCARGSPAGALVGYGSVSNNIKNAWANYTVGVGWTLAGYNIANYAPGEPLTNDITMDASSLVVLGWFGLNPNTRSTTGTKLLLPVPGPFTWFPPATVTTFGYSGAKFRTPTSTQWIGSAKIAGVFQACIATNQATVPPIIEYVSNWPVSKTLGHCFLDAHQGPGGEFIVGNCDGRYLHDMVECQMPVWGQVVTASSVHKSSFIWPITWNNLVYNDYITFNFNPATNMLKVYIGATGTPVTYGAEVDISVDGLHTIYNSGATKSVVVRTQIANKPGVTTTYDQGRARYLMCESVYNLDSTNTFFMCINPTVYNSIHIIHYDGITYKDITPYVAHFQFFGKISGWGSWTPQYLDVGRRLCVIAADINNVYAVFCQMNVNMYNGNSWGAGVHIDAEDPVFGTVFISHSPGSTSNMNFIF